MSTYYNYLFRARLKDASIGTVEDLLTVAGDVDVDFTNDTSTDIGGVPVLGPSITCDGLNFDDCGGLEISDGILSVGMFATNLDWDVDPVPDHLRPSSRLSRLDVLLDLLSRLTEGEPGEIQGVFESEYGYYDHAHPMVRCADGLVRVLKTEHVPRDDYWFSNENDVIVQDRMPADFVTGPFEGSYFTIDMKALIARLTPIDVGPALMIR
jgi:hypothetical protein